MSAKMPDLPPFEPIFLEEMDAIRLMNRIDAKYLTDEETLADILRDACRSGYRALVTEGSMVSPYDSVYYDTADHRMFLDHRNGRMTRQKVRTRSYVSSGLAFLEVKRKNNHGRTNKKRMEIPAGAFRDFAADAAACDYLERHSAFVASQLSPALETSFRRITLVNPEKTERLTIDCGIAFVNPRNGREASLKDGVVIEIKQDGRTESRMKGILLDYRVKPVRVSKYCVGLTLTDPEIRAGRFRERVRDIEKQMKNKLTERS